MNSATITEKIFVTKPYMPPKSDFYKYADRIFETCHVTNEGPLLKELEQKLSNFLKVDNFQYVTNGTIAIQLAIKALGIEEGEIITTPFSYVATTSSILWERCKPVFVDIEPNNFMLDANKIEAAITPKTRAIMPVHVFGYACDVEKIDEIAKKHNLKVIYDAAHAFGTTYKGKSLLEWGDVSTLSFQATKIFHTGEGGACISKDKDIHDKIFLAKHFGITGGVNHVCLGINGKQEEFNAALGLAIYDHISEIFESRKHICEYYDSILGKKYQRPVMQENIGYNYSYYPIVFDSEKDLLDAFDRLHSKEIYPRRYFYPSLHNLPYLEEKYDCPISEDISKRIACLPLFAGMKEYQADKVCKEL